MDIGSFWVYEGKTGWSRSSSTVVEEMVLRWRSEVVGRADSPGFRVAIIQGFPSTRRRKYLAGLGRIPLTGFFLGGGKVCHTPCI